MSSGHCTDHCTTGSVAGGAWKKKKNIINKGVIKLYIKKKGKAKKKNPSHKLKHRGFVIRKKEITGWVAGAAGNEIFLVHEFLFKKPACLQEVFSRAYKLLFLGITACRIYFSDKFIEQNFSCQLRCPKR